MPLSWQFVIMRLKIGKVLKAQGVKGEVKLACFLDNAEMLKGLKRLYIGVEEYAVKSLRADGAFCYVGLQGVADRNGAEELRGLDVFADKELIEIPHDRYFVEDLLGCAVVLCGGKAVGKVTDVLQYGAADVFVCENDGATVSFPFLKNLVVDVDVYAKRITLDDKRFGEVAVYED